MEFRSLNPELCKIMQLKISNLLLKETCNTKDSFLQKSRILIANARESRARGIEGLNDSIKYLSEAISIMVSYLQFRFKLSVTFLIPCLS